MAEIGIDVSAHQPRAVADIIASGQQFAYAVTVCDESSAERCPIFPGETKRLHMGFPDPQRCKARPKKNWKQRGKFAIKSKVASSANLAGSLLARFKL